MLTTYFVEFFHLDLTYKFELYSTSFVGVANSAREEESIAGFSVLRNFGKSTKEGILGTASAPIHMVATEGGQFKEQLWRTIRTIALAFLMISGIGALIEDKGISKGITISWCFRLPCPLINMHSK